MGTSVVAALLVILHYLLVFDPSENPVPDSENPTSPTHYSNKWKWRPNSFDEATVNLFSRLRQRLPGGRQRWQDDLTQVSIGQSEALDSFLGNLLKPATGNPCPLRRPAFDWAGNSCERIHQSLPQRNFRLSLENSRLPCVVFESNSHVFSDFTAGLSESSSIRTHLPIWIDVHSLGRPPGCIHSDMVVWLVQW